MKRKVVLVAIFIFLMCLSLQVYNAVRTSNRLQSLSRRQTEVTKFYQAPVVAVKVDAFTPTGVLILTNHRSGSSFFGELFNQHPDAFYTYEPLVAVQHKNESQAIDLLESILSCEIRGVSEYIQRASQNQPVLQKCLENNICFRNKMKQLCTSAYCLSPQTCTRCLRMSSDEMSWKCRSKKISVAKVIRLENLSSMRTLIEDKKMDIKILHLVRDPRGISSSRRRIKPRTDKNMKDTCKKLLRNIQLGIFETHPWLEGRYKLIRYEDVAMSPMEMAEDVYKYVGLKMTDGIRRWIEVSTKGIVKLSVDQRAEKLRAIRSRRKRERRLSMKKFEKLILSDAYSTVRHSNATWQAWRGLLSPSDVQEIQRDCGDVMNRLGYNLIPSEGAASDFALLSQISSFNGKTISTLRNIEMYG